MWDRIEEHGCITTTPYTRSRGRAIAAVFGCVLLLVMCGLAAAAWVIDGDKVYTNNSHTSGVWLGYVQPDIVDLLWSH